MYSDLHNVFRFALMNEGRKTAFNGFSTTTNATNSKLP